MADPNPRDTPIVMRWVETVSNGSLHWYLAALDLDRQFWGYVHIRTDSLSENRSFVGQLDELKYRQVQNTLNGISPELNDSDGEVYDGVLGLGSQSKFATLIRYNSGTPRLPNSHAFSNIVSVLQPELRIASELTAG